MTVTKVNFQTVELVTCQLFSYELLNWIVHTDRNYLPSLYNLIFSYYK